MGMASLKLEDGESRNLTDSWIDLDDLDRFRKLTLGSVICLIMRMSMEISSWIFRGLRRSRRLMNSDLELIE